MNFKTTIVLLILLIVVGGYLFFFSERPSHDVKTDEKKLVSMEAADVTRVSVTPAEGEKFVFEKQDGEWRITAPVQGPAERWSVEDLVRGLVELRSRGQVEVSAENQSAVGLNPPRWKAELLAKDGKTATLWVGNRSAVGNDLYVHTAESGPAQVTDAAVYEQLDKPLASFRQTKLVDLSTTDIKQMDVVRPEGTLSLRKDGEAWKITAPAAMPAETTEVTDLLMAATGLRAAEFVSEKADDAAGYGLGSPRLSVRLSTAVPATQPATTQATQPAGKEVVIRFGGFDDILKKNVYASAGGPVVKVAATSLDSFKKTPLDLRDRKAVQIDPERVSRIAIDVNLSATTQPTTRPESRTQTTIERRKEELAMGPGLPVTAPATTQAATAPATQPLSKWMIADGAADDSAVDALLHELNPLRAQKYLESPPSATPTGRYTLAIRTEGPYTLGLRPAPVAEHRIEVLELNAADRPVVLYNSLVFEVERSLLDRITAVGK